MGSSKLRTYLAVAMGLVMTATACNAILGFGNYIDQTTDGSPTPGEEGGTDARPDGIAPPPGAIAGQWARWVMPNSPTASADSGLNPAVYTRAVGGPDGVVYTVRVESEGITELRFSGPGRPRATFAEARAECSALKTTGGKVFRLPHRIELVTLMEYGSAQLLPGDLYLPAEYWTDSYLTPPTEPPQFWFVNSGTGMVTAHPATAAAGVVCIQDDNVGGDQ